VETNISNQFIDFFVFDYRVGVGPFEVIEQLHMLLGSKQLEQHVMLRTDSHKRSHLISFAKHVYAENFSPTFGRLVESSEQRNKGRLTCSIVA
jgi:hypothetical protein